MKKIMVITFILLAVILFHQYFTILLKGFSNGFAPSPTPLVQLNANKLFTLVNTWRKAHGMAPYIKSDKLCTIAEDRITNDPPMDNHRGFMAKYFHYPYVLQENIVQSYIEGAALDGWLNSPPHLATLKKPYQYSCIACKGDYCVEEFSSFSSDSNHPFGFIPPHNTVSPSNSDQAWGTVKQVGKFEYQGRFAPDSKMATSNEILIAVNNYRNQNGKGSVNWDNDLANWAQERAQLYATIDLDNHEGFLSEAPSKSQQYGFKRFAEDSSLGGKIEAVHLIEWEFAQDEAHKNVLLSDNNLIGIGIASGNSGYGIDLIFGSK